ncbi:DUF3991 domain-containing protein [Paenibacillus fonticola]|uniref:DUF3991 domain-containing protein n=1 Tax=Paenibacillus fonticola TaxID=379896 RepID=UPI000A04D227
MARYLTHFRGIDSKIVSCLMQEKKLYQQDKTGNCVFVGYDLDGIAKYCSLRGSNSDHPFKQDLGIRTKVFLSISLEPETRSMYVKALLIP